MKERDFALNNGKLSTNVSNGEKKPLQSVDSSVSAFFSNKSKPASSLSLLFLLQQKPLEGWNLYIWDWLRTVWQ